MSPLSFFTKEAIAEALNRLHGGLGVVPPEAKGDYGRGYTQALADVAQQLGIKTRTEYVA